MAKKQSHLPIQIFANIFGGDILEYKCNTDFTRLTTKVVDRLIALEESTDWDNPDLDKIYMPDDISVLYNHVGEIVDISLYGQKWDVFAAEKFVEGVTIRFADDYLYDMYYLDVDMLVENENYQNLLHDLKSAVALFQANGFTDDQIFEAFVKEQEEYCMWRKKMFEGFVNDILNSGGEGRIQFRLGE